VNLAVVPYRIVLADDHVLFRQGIKHILEGVADLEIVGEAGDGLKLLDVVRESAPDMVMLDISMPGLRGIEAVGEIKAVHAGVKVLIVTMHKDIEYLHHAVRRGASGYLLKEDAGTELFSAIERIRQGGLYISPLMSDELTAHLVQMAYKGGKLKSESLTVREREVLKLIAEGKSNKEVARLLRISTHTVQHHRSNIMQKLNVRKTADLVRYALRKGYASAT
jgi:DNA-binding NarL/FixJ family response regulator